MVGKVLKFLYIVQERELRNGRRFPVKQRRLNPYNPLTYVFVIIIHFIGFFWVGLRVLIYENNTLKEFKWN